MGHHKDVEQGVTSGLSKQKMGRDGEEYAVGLLRRAGLRILARNFRCPKGEIDIVAGDRELIVFVEVRSRSSNVCGWGEESITALKQKRLQAVAAYFLLKEGFKVYPPIRFDVIALRNHEQTWEANWIKGIIF